MILLIGRCLLLVTLATTTFSTASLATEPAPASSLSARSNLDRLLRCDEEKKTAILQEQRTVQEHLRKVDAFRGSLIDATKNRLSIDKAEQALAKDREALAKIEERLALI